MDLREAIMPAAAKAKKCIIPKATSPRDLLGLFTERVRHAQPILTSCHTILMSDLLFLKIDCC
jgi:hypothetical protein